MRSGKAVQIGGWLLIYAVGCSHDDNDRQARDAGTTRDAGSGGSTKGAAARQTGLVSRFPGSGTGNAGTALPNGNVCDAVVRTRNQHLITPKTKCLNSIDTNYLAATLEQVLECVEGKDTVHLRLTFDPGFVDNTYGAGSIGWPRKRGHTFVKDLTKSDHAEIAATSGDGSAAISFKLDYISELATAPAGFGSLGVRGGDGKMLLGDAAWVLRWNTSLSQNLNERGYAEYTVSSPATDERYTPNPNAPEWDYRVVYEAWIDVAAFGDTGFGDADVSFVHASPAKSSEDTLKVEPGDCPPPFCQPDDPKCAGSGGVGGSTSDCGPDDPECTGQGGVGGSTSDCGPDDPECFRTGPVAGAPETPPPSSCPPDQPGCSPE